MSEEFIEPSAVVEALPDPEPAAQTSEPIAEPVAAAPEPKMRGRPQGSRDAVKRARKPAIKLRVEPVVRESLAQPTAPPAQPPPQRRQLADMDRYHTTVEPEPPSPRTLFRLHHKALFSERQQKKQEWAQRYTSNWTSWPV